MGAHPRFPGAALLPDPARRFRAVALLREHAAAGFTDRQDRAVARRGPAGAAERGVVPRAELGRDIHRAGSAARTIRSSRRHHRRGSPAPRPATTTRSHSARGCRHACTRRIHRAVLRGFFAFRHREKPMKYLIGLLCIALVSCGAKAPEGTFTQNEAGVVVTPAMGAAKRVRIAVRSDRIVRVTAVPNENLELPASLMAVDADTPPPAFKVENEDGDLTVSTAALVVHVSLASGAVRFNDPAGKTLLVENSSREFGKGVSQRFNPGTDEAFFGLGQHQNAQMNLNGEDVELAQHNMDIGVPFVVSSRNYGVLWDNTSITRFGNPRPYGLASRDLKIRDAAGKQGGFTARYSIKGEQKLERVEKDINYQYIRDRATWPKELLTGKEPPVGAPA